MFPIFLWVKNYKNLKDFQLTLDQSYTIELKRSNYKECFGGSYIKRNKSNFFLERLNIKKNTLVNKEGFYGKNIDGIKAIVGRNGTGKTSILEIMGKFSNVNRNIMSVRGVDEYFILYKMSDTEDQEQERYLIEGFSKKGVNNFYKFVKEFWLKEKPYKNDYFSFEIDNEGRYVRESRNLEKSGCLLIRSQLEKGIDSTKRWVVHSDNIERKTQIYKYDAKGYESSKVSIYNYIFLNLHRKEERYYNFHFCLNILKKDIFKDKIEEKIKETSIKQNIFEKLDLLEKLNVFLEKDNIFIDKKNKKNEQIIAEIILKEMCNRLYVYYIFKNIENLNEGNKIENKIIEMEDEFLELKKNNSINECLLFLLKRIYSDSEASTLNAYIEKLYDAICILEENKLLKRTGKSFSYKFSSRKDERIKNFLEIYDSIFIYVWKNKIIEDEIFKVINIVESGMSAGEEIRLNQFTTLSRVLNGEFKEKKYITLLFDEAETSLHPEWCRTLINDYLEELKINYPDRIFKLIFATHSPFVLSDLLSEDIISLGVKYKKSYVMKYGLKKSFGGNIHNLLKNNMFMESTFGEFARLKIKDFMKEIETTDSLKKLKELSQSLLLKEIGEPLVKRRLEIMIEEKMKSLVNSQEYYEMKIQEYQKKIEELKDE